MARSASASSRRPAATASGSSLETSSPGRGRASSRRRSRTRRARAGYRRHRRSTGRAAGSRSGRSRPRRSTRSASGPPPATSRRPRRGRAHRGAHHSSSSAPVTSATRRSGMISSRGRACAARRGRRASRRRLSRAADLREVVRDEQDRETAVAQAGDELLRARGLPLPEAAVGSSMITIRLPKPAARQIATAWRWPPDRRRTRVRTGGTLTASGAPSASASRRMPRRSSSFSGPSPRIISRLRNRFCQTARSSASARSWWTASMPASRLSSGEWKCSASSPSTIVPACRAVDAGRALDQRRLAGAVVADDRGDLAPVRAASDAPRSAVTLPKRLTMPVEHEGRSGVPSRRSSLVPHEERPSDHDGADGDGLVGLGDAREREAVDERGEQHRADDGTDDRRRGRRTG